MISGITSCFAKYDSIAMKVAHVADCLIACALLIIGICGTQFEFMPSYLAPAFIGAGAVYGVGKLIYIGWIIREAIEASRPQYSPVVAYENEPDYSPDN